MIQSDNSLVVTVGCSYCPNRRFRRGAHSFLVKKTYDIEGGFIIRVAILLDQMAAKANILCLSELF